MVRVAILVSLAAAFAPPALAQSGGYTFRLIIEEQGSPYVEFDPPAINNDGVIVFQAYRQYPVPSVREIVRAESGQLHIDVAEGGAIEWVGGGTILNNAGFTLYVARPRTNNEVNYPREILHLTDGSVTYEVASNTALPIPLVLSPSTQPLHRQFWWWHMGLNDSNDVTFEAGGMESSGLTMVYRVDGAGPAADVTELTSSDVWCRNLFWGAFHCMPSIDAQGRVVIGAWACYQNFPSPGTGCTPSGSDSAVVAAFPRNGPMTFIEQDTVRQYASSSMYGIPMAIDASGAVYYVSGCSWGAEFWLARSDGTVRTTLVTGHDGSNVPAPPFTWREIDAISVNAPGEVLIDGEFDTLGHTIGKDVLMKGTSYPGHVILKEGDVLFGSTVIDITTSSDAINDLGQVAARVRTSDQRTLIVIGDPPPPPPWTYCTAGTSFHGCAAVLSSSGAPSASNQGPFTITATGLPAQTNALFFYGTGAPASLPWGNSTSYLCVAPPSQRMNPGASSGGTTAPACDGTVALEWNDYVASHPSMLGAPFAYGDDVRIQLYYRDPQSGTGPPGAMGTATSDALAFIHGY